MPISWPKPVSKNEFPRGRSCEGWIADLSPTLLGGDAAACTDVLGEAIAAGCVSLSFFTTVGDGAARLPVPESRIGCPALEKPTGRMGSGWLFEVAVGPLPDRSFALVPPSAPPCSRLLLRI